MYEHMYTQMKLSDFMLEKERPNCISTTAFNFMWLLSATLLASNLISSHCH